MNSTEHKAKTVSALRWSGINQFFNQGLVFLVSLILMRFLKPSDFGLLGMVTVFSGFIGIFANFSLSSSLIQKKLLSNEDKDTVFWVSVGLGFLLCLVLAALAPVISNFFNEDSLILITIIISTTFVFQGLGSVHHSLLIKELRYKYIFYVTTSTGLLASVVAISLALNGYGVWALVVQQILKTVLKTLFLWFSSNYRPSLSFSKILFREHMAFSMPLVGKNVLNYWARNIDNFFIGRILGTESLGLYSRSYSIMNLPTSKISGVIASTMFPSLSLIQDDKERLSQIFLKILSLVSFTVVPIMSILSLLSDDFVLIAFGKEWAQMSGILAVLAIVGIIQSLSSFSGTIFLVFNKNNLAFKLGLINTLSLLPIFYFGAKNGLMMLVWGYLIHSLVFWLVSWRYVSSVMENSFNKIFGAVIKPFLICSLVYLFFFVTQRYIGQEWHPMSRLFSVVILFLLLYLSSYLIFFKSELQIIIRSFKVFGTR